MPDAALLDSSRSPEQVLSGLTLFLPPVRPDDRREMHRVGEMLYTPPVLPRWGTELRFTGSIDADISARAGARAARLCSHNLIVLTREELGSLDRVSQVMQLNILVRCSPGFENVSRIADGASEAIFEVFGSSGRHRRTVLATAELPESAPVQVAAIIRFH
jgi:enamine deaminase RidA (YjgF/YER057c/UK114 family)